MNLDAALFLHGGGDLEEASSVGTEDVVVLAVVLSHSISALLVDILHDALEMAINLFRLPAETDGVLSHFETRDSNTTSIASNTRGIDDTVFNEVVHGIVVDTHVGKFNAELDTVLNELLSIIEAKFVLSGARNSDVALAFPWLLAGEELGAGELVSIGLDNILAGGTEFKKVADLLGSANTLFIIDVTIGTRDGDDLSLHLRGLEASTPGNVTEARDANGLAFNAHTLVLEHFTSEVETTEASSFRADEGTTPGLTLAGEDTFEVSSGTLVLAVHVANFASTNTNITSGNIAVWSNVTEEFSHEGLAETHDLSIRLALGVEIRATLSTTHGERGEGVLEDLVEAKELDDGKVNRGMETETTLVWANGGVVLDTEATVDLDLALIIEPWNTEHDDTFGLNKAAHDFSELRALFPEGNKTLSNGLDGLDELFETKTTVKEK